MVSDLVLWVLAVSNGLGKTAGLFRKVLGPQHGRQGSAPYNEWDEVVFGLWL